jgi:hypothetical protein
MNFLIGGPHHIQLTERKHKLAYIKNAAAPTVTQLLVLLLLYEHVVLLLFLL